MLFGHTQELQDRFNVCINTFLDDEYIFVWKLRRRINIYLGDELKIWGENAATIAEWIEEENLHKNSKQWKHMCEALKLVLHILCFMLKAKIDKKYPQEIATFEMNVKELFSRCRNFFERF